MKKTLKFLHEVGATAVVGVMFVQIALATAGPSTSPAQHAGYRATIHQLDQWLLLPGLMLTLVSGALSIAFHKPFRFAEWAVVKALMTPLVLEGTLLVVTGPAKAAAKLTERLASGQASVEASLDRVLSREWLGLMLMLAVFFANYGLSIWRPRLRPHPSNRLG